MSISIIRGWLLLLLMVLITINQFTWFAHRVYAQTVDQGVTSAQDMPIVLPNVNAGSSLESPDVEYGTGSYSFSNSDLLPPDALDGAFEQSEMSEASEEETDLIDYSIDAEASMLANPSSVFTQAYETVQGIMSRPQADLTSDPIWEQSDYIDDNLQIIATDFGDCTTTTVYTDSPNPVNLEDLQRCTRMLFPSLGTCTIAHSFDVLIDPIEIPTEFAAWGPRQINMSLSDQIRNYRNLSFFHNDPRDASGYVEFYARFRFFVEDPAQFTSFYLVGPVLFDNGGVIWHYAPDGTRTILIANTATYWNDGARIYQLAYTEALGWYNPWISDLMPYIQPGWNEIGMTINKSSRRATALQANFSIQGYMEVTNDIWTPQSCVDTANAIIANDCSGTVACTVSHPVTGSCTVINGTQICESDLAPSPIPGISPFCQQVSVNNQSCAFLEETYCYTNNEGIEVCEENVDENIDNCAVLEDDSDCGYISSECVLSGNTGTCLVERQTYDCGRTVNIPNPGSETEYSCTGPIRCMGTECALPPTEHSNDFARAVAASEAIQGMQRDMTCPEDDPSLSECTIFNGEPGWCKIAIAGTVNCCEDPGGVSMSDYISMLRGVGMLDNAIVGLEETNPVRSGWELLRDPAVDAYESLSRPVTEAWQNLTGTATEAGTDAATQGIIQQFQQDLMRETAQWTAETFGADAANMIFTAAGSGTTGEVVSPAFQAGADGTASMTTEATSQGLAMNGPLASAFSTIMFAYMIYMIAMAIITIIYECEDEELETVMKRETRSCVFLGTYCEEESPLLGCRVEHESYCCFNSPLSRMINEQARDQLGLDYGDIEEPNCEGLTIDQMGMVDWSEINLDEWIAILQDTGHFPEVGDMTVDNLTGSGNVLNIRGDRLDAVERTEQRLDEIETDEQRVRFDDIMR